MKVTYDTEVDVLKITLKAVPVEESDEAGPGVIFDFDKGGNVVGIEILDASSKIDGPQTMEYAVFSPQPNALADSAVREKPPADYGGPGVLPPHP